jgi:hypothetical protein
MNKTLMAIAIAMPVFLSFTASAQISDYTKTVNSTGGTATVGTDIHEWSVGELVITTESSPSLVVTQGVLQPTKDASNVKGIDNLRNTLAVYPNPTQAIVNLKGDFNQSGELNFILMDAAGKTVSNGKWVIEKGTSIQQLDMRTLADGAYMLNVLYNANNKQQQSASFKIEKMQ